MKTFKTRHMYQLFIAILTAVLVTGCSGGSEHGHWDGLNPDTTKPRVTVTVPVHAATGVVTNRKMAVTFTEAMDPATINTTTFKVVNTTLGGSAVAGTVTLGVAGKIATFTPTSLLPVSTLFTARVTTGATDLAGNSLAGNQAILPTASDYVWNFTTGTAADTTKPSVTLTVPADAATGVATNSTVAATFSEAMDPLTITDLTFTLFDGATAIGGTVDYLGVVAIFTPTANLNPNTTYTATIAATVTDLADNQLAGNQAPLPAASAYIWTFDTGAAADIIAPTVTITNPDDLAIDVPVNQTINATFSEAMKATTMTVANFSLQETVSGNTVNGTVAYNIVNHIATFSPLAELLNDTDYTATVSNQAQDLAGNTLVVPPVNGLPTPNPWTFRTAAIPPVPLAINLGIAESFGLASRAGMTSTGVTVVNGDVALWPLGSCTDSTGNAGASQDCLVAVYSTITGMTVNGTIYWPTDADSGATALAVTTDLNVAWVAGFAKVDTLAGVLLGELGAPGPVGKIIVPGVYNEANLGFAASNVATFDALNDANAIFIIKVGTVGGAGDFTDSGTLLLPTEIKLVNGAQARNIWFVVGRDITIGHGTTWNGNILAGRDVTVNDGSTVLGRVLAGAGGAGALVLTGAASPSVTTVTVP